MQFDMFTVHAIACACQAVLAVTFLAMVALDRHSPWLACWAGALFLMAAHAFMNTPGMLANLFVSRSVGAGSLILAMGLCWSCARSFQRRSLLLWVPIASAMGWAVLCTIPEFLNNLAVRSATLGPILCVFALLAAHELHKVRKAERLISLWPAILTLVAFAVFFALRLPFSLLLFYEPGALNVVSLAVSSFTLLVLSTIMSIQWVALGKERGEHVQRRHALTDVMTGLLNRRAFEEQAGTLLRRHAGEKEAASLLLFDLDHFKRINDRHGHAVGDRMLHIFATTAETCLRPTDVLYRLGGEEFACLMPYTEADHARLVAERVRRAFAEAGLVLAGRRLTGTVSIGIATTSCAGYDVARLFSRADFALYAAKRNGRDRTEVADTLLEGSTLPLGLAS